MINRASSSAVVKHQEVVWREGESGHGKIERMEIGSTAISRVDCDSTRGEAKNFKLSKFKIEGSTRFASIAR